MWNLNIWEDIFDWLNIMQFHMHDICETWKVKDVPVSQLKPVHPLLHVQLYEPGLLWHVPCVQGSERHSSISSKRERELPDHFLVWNVASLGGCSWKFRYGKLYCIFCIYCVTVNQWNHFIWTVYCLAEKE